MILELTPAMAEHACWIDAGFGRIYDNLTARKDARSNGRVFVATYTRKGK